MLAESKKSLKPSKKSEESAKFLIKPHKVFVYKEPVNMGRSFKGLKALIQTEIKKDPKNGQLYLFRNRKGDHVKCIYWEDGGFCIWQKKLESGFFNLQPQPMDKDLSLPNLHKLIYE